MNNPTCKDIRYKTLFHSNLRIIVALLVALMPSVVFAQHSKKAEKAYEAAQEAYFNRDFNAALNHVNKVIADDPTYAEAWMLKGELGMQVKDREMARDGYEHSLSLDSMLFPPAAISLARIYDEAMEYDKEVKLLTWFRKNASGNKANDETVAEMTQNAIFRSHAVKHPVRFNPKNLGNIINTVDDEYINMLQFNGSQLVFTRRFQSREGDRMDESLFVASSKDGQWSDTHRLELDWDYNDNMGAAFVTADGRQLYFTGCGVIKDCGCDLFSSESTGDGWGNPIHLGKNVNSSSWDSQPCVSADGKELYFVSRRSGNSDIYRSVRNDDGTWAAPENLGAVINTNGTEMAPYLHPDGKTLYFSSNKHVGMGGSDLFVSRRGADGQWEEPVNLGYPVNTPDDEINFIVAADGKTALISSFREGGFGGYDIYSFELEDSLRPEPVTYIKAGVFDKQSRKRIPAVAKFYDPTDGVMLYSFESNDGDIFAVLPSRKSYSFEVTSPGYLFLQQSVAPTDNSELKPYEFDVYLDRLAVGSVVSLHNIQFEFNSAELTADSRAGIVMLADFLEQNPDISVELAGHTDNVGGDAYNKKLSSDRAEVVKAELIRNGIAATRLTAKGYGASKPLVENDTEAHRAENRRTEMVVVKAGK